MRKPVLAQELMRRPVRQLTAWTPMREAAAFLLRQGISGAPVIDKHGRWIGVFTLNDMARYLQKRKLAEVPHRTLESREWVDKSPDAEEAGDPPVREYMTPGLYTVFPESTLEEVVHTMTTFKVHRVFVLEERSGELLGVITSMDLLRWMDHN